MASIVRKDSKTGVRYDIQLSPTEHPDRPKIALGRIKKDDVLAIKTHIQRLLRHKMGAELSPLTQEWLVGIPDFLRRRLEKLDLIKSQNKGKSYTVKSWCEEYIKMRKNDKKTKDDTIRKMENVSNRLSLFFKGIPIEKVNPLEAKNFRAFLTGTVKLAENTTRKHIAISRQFFNAAIENRIISENPFKGQPVTIRANKTRFFYVTSEIAQKVLNTCPDAEWRLIFGLTRFGGLRCPSEVLRLKWQDIDFEKDQFTVHASKTEHHADGGIRTVPMFPELKPLFQDVFDQAKSGTIYCITRYRDKTVNLRTQLTRIINRAGLEPWPKLFQNCRSTRETELFKLTGGNIKAVCEWIGNSPAVAMQHYAQITEADMKQAAKLAVLNDAGKKVHNRVHTTGETPEMSRKGSQKKIKDDGADSSNSDTTSLTTTAYEQTRDIANICDNPFFCKELEEMGPAGLEPATGRL